MLKKLLASFFTLCIILNFYGCASMTGPDTGARKEPKLFWNVSYIRGLVIVKEALKEEKIQFGNVVINKDAADLKGNYVDGRTVQIVIFRINNSESSLVARVGNSQNSQEDASKLLAAIAQYSKRPK